MAALLAISRLGESSSELPIAETWFRRKVQAEGR
jgi:hypothetical protein